MIFKTWKIWHKNFPAVWAMTLSPLVCNCISIIYWGFPGGSYGKESACNAGDPSSIPGLGRPPGKGNGNPLQCSWLENPMDRGAWHYILAAAAAAAKSLQLCPTLCGPRDSSPSGSPVPGTLQARTQDWVAISVSNAWKWKVKEKSLSLVWLLATPWTAAYEAPPSMGFARQEYWSGLPLPSLIYASV